MNPILNVSYLEAKVVRQEVGDLSSGLLSALEVFELQKTREDYDELVLCLSPLTVESMSKLRSALPGLHVTAHFLTPEDSTILDRS